ncbi:MAG: cysteine--tRNA ligase, partial [Acidimicrobiaceae bacterium]|nr:cysteine--tRNA ligase [Acidimicrobiaceae bacterium]
VYLRVGDVSGYGDLVHRDLDDLRASAGARVEVDEAKEDPLDFALWKAAKPDEPSWPSPWGPGRPGWHIECVAMSLGILGDDFDIHGGGNDLVFPHHTNERAEALAVGRSFARHWVHNAMLNIEGTKMSKSLGNYRTVVEMLDEHPDNGRAFRLLVLQTHYRKTMEVNADLMASARAACQRLDALARRAAVLETAPESANCGIDESAVDAFRIAMDDDLGTPQAVAVIFETLRRANAALDRGADDAPALVATVINLAGALGVAVDAAGRGADAGDAAIEDLVARRQAAREAKDWATADALRDELSALGVVVEDTPAGPIWHRA